MYKRNDYITFMTKKPEVHLNEMFGHNNLTKEDFEKTEYVGFIMQVHDDNTYLVMTVRPLKGFRCTIDEADILHPVDKRDLSKEEKAVKEMVEFTAPNVYYAKAGPTGETLEEKCVQRAREAMACLFPNDEIASVEFCNSDFKKSDLLNRLRGLFILFRIKGRDAELEEVCNKFENLLNAMHFKEYYTVRVGIYEDLEKTSILYYYLAIDLKLEEVIITRNIEERTRFFRSLGPDYDLVYDWKMYHTRNLLKCQ